MITKRMGTGPPIVFVHGSFGGLDSWDPVIEHLPDFDCWTYVRRGYAGSAATFATDATDLAEIVDGVGRPAHIVGGSHGATVALHAALAGCPMASLTIFEPPLFAAGPALAPTLEGVRALAPSRPGAAAQMFLREVAHIPDEFLGDADDSIAPELAGAISDLESMVADTVDLTRWGGLTVPVQLVSGELTWSPMPAAMVALHAALPNGTPHHVLAGQSHFATHTAPAEFAALVRGFVSRSKIT